MRSLSAHNTLAITKLQQWDWSGADVELTAASELDPNDPVARNWHANCLAALGRFDEAVEAARRAIELDPLALAWNMGLGHMYYLARRYDEAIEQERRTLAIDPAFYMTHWILGLAYQQKGRLAESVAELEQAVTLSGSTLMRGLLGPPMQSPGVCLTRQTSWTISRVAREAPSYRVTHLRSFTQVWARTIVRSIFSNRHARNPHSI